ncbi:MAG: RNA methyltransferase [Rhodocyclaceae bacterium]|nr:RNA methyltransferase [Rhodocyclaceae bacterium]
MRSIGSRDNGLIKRARAICRSPRECRKLGETLLDGPHLVAAALAADVPLKAVLVAESALADAEIGGLVARLGDKGHRVADELMTSISPVSTPTGIVALMDIPAAAPPDIDGDLLVLDGIQDAGNVGTMLRTAAAAGLRQAILTPGCAQAWSPKVLRAAMGAHFVLSIVEQARLDTLLDGYRGTLAATLPGSGSVSLFTCDLRGKVAWLFGAEGAGLSPDLAARADLKIRIPLAPAVESLNVSSATAICLFEQCRQRQGGA